MWKLEVCEHRRLTLIKKKINFSMWHDPGSWRTLRWSRRLRTDNWFWRQLLTRNFRRVMSSFSKIRSGRNKKFAKELSVTFINFLTMLCTLNCNHFGTDRNRLEYPTDISKQKNENIPEVWNGSLGLVNCDNLI